MCVSQPENKDAPIVSSCITIESLILAKKLSDKKKADLSAKMYNSTASANSTAFVEQIAKRIIDSAGNSLKNKVQKFVRQHFESKNNLIAVVLSSVTSILCCLLVGILLVRKFWAKIKNALGNLNLSQKTSCPIETIRLVEAEEGKDIINPIEVTPVQSEASTQADSSGILVVPNNEFLVPGQRRLSLQHRPERRSSFSWRVY